MMLQWPEINSVGNKGPAIDLFSFVLFVSHFRPHDFPKGIFLLFFHKLCIHYKIAFERDCSLE